MSCFVQLVSVITCVTNLGFESSNCIIMKPMVGGCKSYAPTYRKCSHNLNIIMYPPVYKKRTMHHQYDEHTNADENYDIGS